MLGRSLQQKGQLPSLGIDEKMHLYMRHVRPSRRLPFMTYSKRKESGGRSNDGSNARKSDKGDSYKNSTRRRGRPAWTRSPDDTPLRDGNRDRLMGLLTERAAKTLLYYMFELNPTLYGWWLRYLEDHPIPRDGNWDDISGETFLRELMALSYQETSWGSQRGVPSMYDCTGSIGVDPRNLAQRVMDIRSQIAKEWIEELKSVSEENALLMRESLVNSFSLENLPVAESDTSDDEGFVHPEMMLDPEVDDSAAGGDD